MHWQDLQKTIVQRYFHDGPISSRHSPRLRSLCHRVLAEVPSTHLSRDDALVRLRKRKRCDKIGKADSSLESWAKTAIRGTLSQHRGVMHWRGLQRALVQRYIEQCPARKLEFESEVGKLILARVPETYLSHDDASVRLCAQTHLTAHGTRKRVHLPRKMSSGRGRRKLMKRLQVRLVAQRTSDSRASSGDTLLAVMATPAKPVMGAEQPAVMRQPLGSPVCSEVHSAPQAAGGLRNLSSPLVPLPAQPVVAMEATAVVGQPFCSPVIPIGTPAPLAARLQNLRSVLTSTPAPSETDTKRPAVMCKPLGSQVNLCKSLHVTSPTAVQQSGTALAPPCAQQQPATMSNITESAPKTPASPQLKFVNGRLQYVTQRSNSEKTPSLQSRAGGA